MLPWAEMLRSAGLLGLTPRDFWACSLKEWIWLAAGHGDALDRAGLDQLTGQFPDTQDKTESNHGSV